MLDESRGMTQGPVARLGKLAFFLISSCFKYLVTENNSIDDPKSLQLGAALLDMLFHELTLVSTTTEGIHVSATTNLTSGQTLDTRCSSIVKLLCRSASSTWINTVLTSPRWLTILMQLVRNREDQILQRRLYRLLRSLLYSIEPEKIFCLLDFSIKDEDLSDEYILSKLPEHEKDSSKNIVCAFVELTGRSKPSSSEEAKALLRVLLGNSEWSKIIYGVIEQQFLLLNSMNSGAIAGADQSRSSVTRSCISCLDVLGAGFERLWVGGAAIIHPLVLANSQTDLVSVRANSASHSCGLVVSNTSNGLLEVVLGEGKQLNFTNKSDSTHHIVPSYPARSVELKENELLGACEILVSRPIPSHVAGLIEKCFLNRCLPLITATDTKQNKETDIDFSDSKNEYLLCATVFRSLAHLSVSDRKNDHDMTVNILNFPPSAIQQLVRFSTSHTTSGSMGSLEILEMHLTKIMTAMDTTVPEALDEVTSSSESTSPSIQHSALASPISFGNPGYNAGFYHGSYGRGLDEDNGNRNRGGWRDNADRAPPIGGRGMPPSSVFSMFGLGRPGGIDPTASVQQMLEMGFPQEWCEYALRRCGYNVELAINLCFERSSEMAQLIEEERELSSREPPHSGRNRWSRAPSFGGRDPLSMMSPFVSGQNPFNVAFSERDRRDRDQGGYVRGRGRGRERYTRPFGTSDSPFAAAPTYEENHSNLSGSDPHRTQSSSPVGRSALVCISGSAMIADDLICQGTAAGGFPSLGCRGYGVTQGKWYYEVTLLTAGCIQIGWVDSEFTGDSDKGM